MCLLIGGGGVGDGEVGLSAWSFSFISGKSWIVLFSKVFLIVAILFWKWSRNYKKTHCHSVVSIFITFKILCVHVQSLQSCPILCDPMDYSPPGSPVHGILQARILEWVASPFSRGLSPPRYQTSISCTAGGFFTAEPLGKPFKFYITCGKEEWGLKLLLVSLGTYFYI